MATFLLDIRTTPLRSELPLAARVVLRSKNLPAS